MCGIAGIFHLDGRPVSSTLIKRMTDSLSHRGPDGEGIYLDQYIGLGHRRLAVVDLTDAGLQPISSSDNRYTLTYNGEIYNFPEIRSQLERYGYQFRSRTDSEVVLYAWAQWGSRCVNKFNGMFAFGLWDSVERVLYVVRDRYGIKPIYYTRIGKTFLFGSEQRAIKAHPTFRTKLDEAALVEYLTFQNLFGQSTLTQDIQILPAGHIARIDRSGNLKLQQYWDFEFDSFQQEVDEREYREELQRLLEQAVKRNLISDVEIGTYLSGGVDSGTITAISAQERPSLKTFTCGFDLSTAVGMELGFDERIRAESMSALFKTEHYEIVINSSDMERCIDEVVAQIEEPRVGQSYPNFLVAKLASRFVKVVMSGTGGDELFGGYPWRYMLGVDHLSERDFGETYFNYWSRLTTETELRQILEPIWPRVSDVSPRDLFNNVLHRHGIKLRNQEDYTNQCLYFEAKTFLHGLLTVEDKLSMAHGIETRVPLLDNDLVDFAMRCPVQFKIRDAKSSFRIDENAEGNKRDKFFHQSGYGKSILRDAMSNFVPPEIYGAKKQGFSSPDASWFRGSSATFVNQRLSNSKSPLYDYIDYRTTQELIAEHQSGTKNRRLLMWSLLSLESLSKHEFSGS
jgi:asparagine synthase (glutamine-hydrolysing)